MDTDGVSTSTQTSVDFTGLKLGGVRAFKTFILICIFGPHMYK